MTEPNGAIPITVKLKTDAKSKAGSDISKQISQCQWQPTY